MLRIRRHILLVALCACAIATAASAQTTTEGPLFKVNAAEISIGGRVQTLFSTTSVEDEPSTDFLLRRVRLEAAVKVNDVVSGKVQPEFAGSRVSLKDAFLLVTLDPALQLLAGQTFRPFSLLTQTSSTRILPIERGVEIRGLADALDHYNLVSDLGYAERDVGFQVLGAPRGAPLGLSYAAGIFNGPARKDAGGRDTYQAAARVAVRPVSAVRIGTGWSSRDFASQDGLPEEEVALERGNAFEVDLEIGSFAPGVHFLGEVAYGDYDPFVGTRFLGAQGWLAYRTGKITPTIAHLEPVIRVSHGNPDVNDRGDGAGGGTLLTPGLNLYLGGLNRVMFNYDVWMPESGERESSFKTMFQLAF